MQFQLRTMFIVVTAAALFCGVVFGVSATWCGIALLVSMLITPAIWLTAALNAEGKQQIFFRAGLIAGAMPFVCCAITMAILISQAISNGGLTLVIPAYAGDPSDASVKIDADTDLKLRLGMAGVWLMPGVFSLLGGAASLLTYRLIKPRPIVTLQKEQPATPQGMAGYRVVSGRLSTVQVEPLAVDALAPASRET